jgi:hypothetical protein
MNLKQLVLGASLGFAEAGSKLYTPLTGTIAVELGSTAIVGTGTNFDPQIGAVGAVTNTLGIAGQIVTLTAVGSDTGATLASAWGGDSASGLTGYYETGTLASATLKPTTAVPTHWFGLGTVMDPDFDSGAEFDDVMTAENGALELQNQLLKSSKPVWKLKMNEVSEKTLQAGLGASAAMTNAVAAILRGGTYQLRGWFQFKCKAAGTQALVIEQWGIATVKGLKMPGTHVMPEIEIRVLANSLNTATSTLASV